MQANDVFFLSTVKETSMTALIRWGILGTGGIAHQFATALRDVPDARLVAVGSRALGTAQRFAQEFGGAGSAAVAAYASYEELVNDPQVDVVYVASPHTLHAANVKLCLQANKPVLCEKPFTVNARQARELVKMARSKKLFLMDAMWTRFLPGIEEAQRLIALGTIGKLHHVQADFGFYSGVGPEHRNRNLELGGGALLDLGIYPLAIAAQFLGPIARVHAIAELGSTGSDEQTAFTLQHTGGGLSTCFCSFRASTPISATISGELGAITIAHPFFDAQRITIAIRNGETRQIHVPKLGNGYPHEAIEVGRCLRTGLLESPAMPLDETIALIEVMDTMRSQFGLVYPADKD
jgi:predicted dehydrogenase